MFKEIKILAKLELCNLYGLNVIRFSKDKRVKRRSLGLLAVWLLLLAMVVFYVGNLAYGMIFLGLGEAVPAYLITISSLLIFAFGMFKAAGTIFRREGYDILCALPLPKGAVAVSRLLRMYVEDLLLALAVFLPGMAVYAWNVHPGIGFYFTGLLGIGSVPLIPMAASIFIGTVITAISSRMRHKSLASAGLSIVAVLGIMYGSSRLSAMENMDPQMLKNLSDSVMALLGKVYPPAVWLGTSITGGDILGCAAYTLLALAVFAVAAAGVALCFRKICQALYGSVAKHDYQMGTLKASSVLFSLCRREFARYFSSSIYVTNTIIGPIMGCVLSGALLVTGTETFQGFLPVPIDISQAAPFVIAGVSSMMATTATSISLEGKNWWILKSLPLSTKNILDAKILMGLLLILPFYLLSELLLIIACRPEAGEILWMLLIPAVTILFSSVYGITINLHLPVLEWESEVRIVKQSASSLLGGMGGPVLAILWAVAVGAVPKAYGGYLKAVICFMILAAAAALYRQNNRFDLCGKI